MKSEDLENKNVNISDSEIRALAGISHKAKASIIESKTNGIFTMSLCYDDNRDGSVIISSDNYDEYKKMSNEFFKLFVKYGGSISLADVFMD